MFRRCGLVRRLAPTGVNGVDVVLGGGFPSGSLIVWLVVLELAKHAFPPNLFIVDALTMVKAEFMRVSLRAEKSSTRI